MARKNAKVVRKSGRAAWALALAVICVIAYDPWRPENSSGDTISTRLWPAAVLQYHTWRLDAFRPDLRRVGYAGIFAGEKELLPRNGWGMLAFSLPVYAAMDAFGGGGEWTLARINRASRYNAIALTTLAVLALFALASRFVAPGVAFGSALYFALGTWSWSMAPQGLYSQTVIILLHMLNLLVLWNFSSKREGADLRLEGALLGLVHAALWSVRPQDIVLVLPEILLIRKRKALLPYLIAGASVAGPIAWGYHRVYGYYTGAYGVIEALGVSNFRWNFLRGAAGLLVSPNRGALVFFPMLLFVPYLWRKFLPTLRTSKRIPAGFADVCGQGALLYFAMLSFLIFWHSGWAYGSRYLYDLLPYVWMPVTFLIEDLMKRAPGLWNRIAEAAPRAELRARAKAALPLWCAVVGAALVVESVFVHGLGHFNYDIYVWNWGTAADPEGAAWKPKPWIIAEAWKAGSNRHRWDKMTALQRLQWYGF